MSAPVVERIGSYRIEACLGEGGMGVVYLAHDERLARTVAIKVIRPEHVHDEASRRRFDREARALSRLDHPNICRIHDSGIHEECPYLVMQCVQGDTLAAWIRQASSGAGPLMAPDSQSGRAQVAGMPSSKAVATVTSLVETLARALHYAHTRGIVHRDVKPANIVITPEGQPVLLDFGIARDESAQRLTLSDQLLGTPLYMAPEQIDPGRHSIDARTDVWALGAVLFEAITLRPPFLGATPHALATNILDAPLPDPRRTNPAIGRDLHTVLTTAMAKAPEHRYRDAEAMAEDLRRIRAKLPIVARPPTWAIRAVRWTQRNPLATAVLALLALSVAVTGMALLSATRSSARMTRSLTHFDRLAVVQKLQQARSAAEALVPAWPDKAMALERWLEEHGRPLREQVGEVRSAIAELASLLANASVADIDEVLDPESLRFLLRELQQRLPQLEHFASDPRGLCADVQRRLDWAQRTEGTTRQHPAWERTIAAIAASPLYGGLRLRPQYDLVPLGADPGSGLHEFLHVPSQAAGAPLPGADPAPRPLRTGEATGLIFVLVPATRFIMGTRSAAEGKNGATDAEPDEAENEVTLAPYFLSKYEMTQAQWMRLADDGANPSRFVPATPLYSVTTADGVTHELRPLTLEHPAEQMSWEQCMLLLRRQGLTLPTEAQWEHACRADGSTVWSCGDSVAGLAAVANLPDYQARIFSYGTWSVYYDWDDGYPVTAPVGRFLPNRFGFHDMHGNVSEWCLDQWVLYQNPTDPVTGLRQVGDTPAEMLVERIHRGGSCQDPVRECRSTNRLRAHKDTGFDRIGLRPARAVLP